GERELRGIGSGLQQRWGRAAPRFLSFRQFQYTFPEQITLLAPAPPAWTAKQKARRPTESTCGPVAGWGEQRLLFPASAGNSHPRCARAEANREGLSLPRDSNCRAATGDIVGTLGSVAGDSASRLGRQAATPVVRQRTSVHQKDECEAVAVRAFVRVRSSFPMRPLNAHIV